jgi:hypothetical protein
MVLMASTIVLYSISPSSNLGEGSTGSTALPQGGSLLHTHTREDRYLLERPNYAPVAQLAEVADLKSVCCRFESDQGHQI